MIATLIANVARINEQPLWRQPRRRQVVERHSHHDDRRGQWRQTVIVVTNRYYGNDSNFCR